MKKWNDLSKQGKYKRLKNVEPYIRLNTDSTTMVEYFDYYYSKYEAENPKDEIDLNKAREYVLTINNDWIQEMIA